MALRLGPLGGLGVLIWGIAVLLLGYPLEAVALLLLLGLALGSWRVVARLVGPLVLLTWGLLSVMYGVWESVDTVARLAVLALSASVGLSRVSPVAFSRFLLRLGLPASVAASFAMVYRFLDHLSSLVHEARDALAGRGAGGRWSALLRLPIPLVVHSFRSSMLIAEAVYFKPPTRESLGRVGRIVEPWDLPLLAALALAALVLVIVGRS